MKRKSAPREKEVDDAEEEHGEEVEHDEGHDEKKRGGSGESHSLNEFLRPIGKNKILY